MQIIIIFVLALILDVAFRESPNGWHPVAWLGKLISFEMKYAPSQGMVRQCVFGGGIVMLTLTSVTAAIYFLLFNVHELNIWLSIVLSAILLKFTFSLRGLIQAAEVIRTFLSKDNLAEARLSLQSLVSRETSGLSKKQIIAATVESVAENSCDSFIAPLFYFLIFGIPGAIAYRIINTFDSMIGYHGTYEHLGKFAARLDDIANFVPARIAALLMLPAGWLCRQNLSQTWRIMVRDHKKTESPNAGWTMSALAGAMGILLEKTGHYSLGDNRQTLSINTIDISLRIITVVALIWSLLTVLIVQGWYYVTT